MIDEAKINELKSKHGAIFMLRGEKTGHEIIVRKPTEAAWKRFRAQTGDPAKRSMAPEALLRDCVVHPDQEGLDSMLAEYPGLVEAFAGELGELGGAVQSVEKKPCRNRL
jgi:hypothetical protein